MKPYTVIYTNDSPKPPRAQAGISVNANNMICVQVPFPSHCFLTQVVVKLISGTATSFTVDIYKSVIPFAVGQYVNTTTPTGNKELYRAIPTQTSSAGIVDAEFADVGYEFENVDGSFTVNQRYLYLVITPTGNTGATVFDAAITARVFV